MTKVYLATLDGDRKLSKSQLPDLVDKSTYDESIAEIDNKLSGKSESTHIHDDRYYTESEIDNKLSGKSESTHNHDDSYYTKTETDNKLSDKSDSTHTHDDVYYKKEEVYTKIEADSKFGSIGVSELETKVNTNTTNITNLSDNKADKTDVYTKEETDNKLLDKSNTSHNHNDSYYSKLEMDNTISNLQDMISGISNNTSHNHDESYYSKSEVDNIVNNLQGAINEIEDNISYIEGTTITVNILYNVDASTITLTKGSQTFTKDVVNGEVTFELPELGVWTITNNQNSKVSTVNIYYYGIYNVDLTVYKVMTIKMDTTNSDPETCITYADDAVGMTPGSAEWDNFFGHYPCLFKNGAEVGKLNPNNFAQFEDGTSADITSGDAGDVMIAFPKLGYKISLRGSTLTVSMTNNPNAEGYCYLAHTRGTAVKDVFYLGAYKGRVEGVRLRSLSGKYPTANTTISSFRTFAQNNGPGYDQSAFYQTVFRQCMYLLKYKNLNSQKAVGQGYVNGSSAVSTGGTNTNGMDYGTTSQTQQVKLFGLEDFWGNVYEWVDGIYCDSSYNILTATENFNDIGSGYFNRGFSGFSSDTGGYMTKVAGISEMGFTLKESYGSQSTYFCDSAYVYASRLASFGGSWDDNTSAGAFNLSLNRAYTYYSSHFSARLMYL